MKQFFRKQNILTFFLIYGILTIAVSLFYLIAGIQTDPLGYWHEIYRFFFVLILLLLFDFIRNLSLKKSCRSFLGQLLPLLIALLGFGAVLYLKGDIGLDRIIRYLMYFLAAVIGIFLLRAVFNALRSWLKNLFSGKRKIYFSFMSLLLLVILAIPFGIYILIIRSRSFVYLSGNGWYLASLIVLVLVLIGLFLSQNPTDEFNPLTIILILCYYVIWFLIGYYGITKFRIILMQLSGCGILLAYENHNGFHHCIALTMLLALLSGIAAYFN